MVEGEAGLGLVLAAQLAVLTPEDEHPGALLRLPAVVLDERSRAARQSQRVDDEREVDEHGVALGQGEAVHVGGLGDAVRGDPALAAACRLGEDPVLAARAEVGDIGDQLVADRVVVGMRGRVDSGRLEGDAERLQGLGVEGDRQRRLGHRHVFVAQSGQVDVAVVGQPRPEQGRRALEDRAARVGGELAVVDAALLRGAEGAATEVAVGVGDPAAAEGELVQHRQAVEPVAQLAIADLELGRSVAQQGAGKPIGDGPLHGQAVELDLVRQRGEPLPVSLAGYGLRIEHLTTPFPHDLDWTV